MIVRAVPILATLPDGSQVGTEALTPAVLHVHDSGWATIMASKNTGLGPEVYEAFRGKVVEEEMPHVRAKPWGVIPLTLPTENGNVVIARGAGCACGHPIKTVRPMDPGVNWLEVEAAHGHTALPADGRVPPPATPPQTEF